MISRNRSLSPARDKERDPWNTIFYLCLWTEYLYHLILLFNTMIVSVKKEWALLASFSVCAHHAIVHPQQVGSRAVRALTGDSSVARQRADQ